MRGAPGAAEQPARAVIACCKSWPVDDVAGEHRGLGLRLAVAAHGAVDHDAPVSTRQRRIERVERQAPGRERVRARRSSEKLAPRFCQEHARASAARRRSRTPSRATGCSSPTSPSRRWRPSRRCRPRRAAPARRGRARGRSRRRCAFGERVGEKALGRRACDRDRVMAVAHQEAPASSPRPGRARGRSSRPRDARGARTAPGSSARRGPGSAAACCRACRR